MCIYRFTVNGQYDVRIEEVEIISETDQTLLINHKYQGKKRIYKKTLDKLQERGVMFSYSPDPNRYIELITQLLQADIAAAEKEIRLLHKRIRYLERQKK